METWAGLFSELKETETKPRVVFCHGCHSILPLTSSDTINCPKCDCFITRDELQPSDISNSLIPTIDIRDSISVSTNATKKQSRAVVNEECPECGNAKMFFHTMQLRSVDEGTTVFYECTKCGHKYSTNN
eukprot:TRINITY_DN11029_c0_g1_i1.p1 TRINITY_DN11029_c0_g1~~TRINITY_DN11029_c0_g1_i1.p1  ORF type:complete len:130 (+),score=3.53 TRINITY_DN11029_c0_g1_i1:39-428(+)